MSFKINTLVTGLTVGFINATDGTPVTVGTPVGYVTIDGGVQAAIGDVTPVHEGNGQFSFDLTALEMNGAIIGLVFTLTNAIPVYYTIKTVAKLTSDLLDFNSTTDTVANVTLVATTTANTDMRGNDNANTVVPLDGAGVRTAVGLATANMDTQFTASTTAVGFSTFNPATDTVANVATVANNTDMRGNDNANTVVPPSLAEFNARSIPSAEYFVVTDYTAPDNATIATISTDTATNIPALINALNVLTPAQVKAELVAALTADAIAEPTSIPLATAPLSEKIAYLFAYISNEQQQTDGLQTIRNKANTLNISTATITSNGTTTTRGGHS